jgi:type I restriction enzyme S subunit
MNSANWTTTTFGQLIADGMLEIGDGYRAKNSELGGEGLIFLRAGHVRDTLIDLDNADRFLEELAPRVASKTSRPGDVLLTTKGNSTGRVGYVSENMPTVVYSPHLSYWRSRKPDQLVPGFLRAWSTGPELRFQVQALAHGTDMAPYLSLVDQHRLRITIPPLPEQRAIAHILGTLDDKLALNRQMNQTLEQIAAALFTSWFVDFDPVRAKAAGRHPEGIDAETAALFPDRFVESEIGEIPEGWQVVPVADIVGVVGGSTPSTKEPKFWGGDIPFATPKDLSKIDAPVLLGTERHITEAGVARISSGLIPRRSVLLSSRAPIGYLAINDIPVTVNQGMIVMICNKGVSPWFVLGWAQLNKDEFIGRANGTTFLEISKTNFRPIPVVLPTAGVLAAFDSIAGPLFARLTANVRQNQTLAELRDILLPRLLSGELRVPLDILNEEDIPMPAPREEALVQSTL